MTCSPWRFHRTAQTLPHPQPPCLNRPQPLGWVSGLSKVWPTYAAACIVTLVTPELTPPHLYVPRCHLYQSIWLIPLLFPPRETLFGDFQTCLAILGILPYCSPSIEAPLKVKALNWGPEPLHVETVLRNIYSEVSCMSFVISDTTGTKQTLPAYLQVLPSQCITRKPGVHINPPHTWSLFSFKHKLL